MSGFQTQTTTTLEILRRYSLVIWHRAWLLVFLTLLGALAGYLYSKSKTPMYMGTMQVMVLRPVQEQASDLTRTMTNEQISETYAQLTRLPSFSEQVIERSGKMGFVSGFALPDTQLISLTVQTPDREAIIPLLDTAVDVLVDEIRALQVDRYHETEAGLTIQVEEVEAQISRTQTELNERYTILVAAEKDSLETQIFGFQQELAAVRAAPKPDAQRISQLQTRLVSAQQAYTALLQTNRVLPSKDAEVTRLERTLALYQNLYNNLLTNLENVRLARIQGTPSVVRMDEPFAPPFPFSPNTRRNTILFALAGLGAALGLVVLLEFLDDTLKSPETIRQRLGLYVLGWISETPVRGLVVELEPRSPVSEAYRSLRTSLAFSGVDKPARLVLVTSCGAGEGKTTVAANLAAALAQGGRKVLLIDANLRRPALHRLLDLQNRVGLSDVFRSGVPVIDLIQVYRGDNKAAFGVLTSGSLPPNPLELLSSARMQQVVEETLSLFDVVLLDSSPLVLPDGLVLSAWADGVLLVGQAGKTRMDTVHATLELLARSRARVLGLVVNRVVANRARYQTLDYAGYFRVAGK